MRNLPIPHQIYKHFKGNLYQISCVAKHSETGEEMVVYQAMYGDYSFYVRPLSMFMEKVDKVKYPNVQQEYRFELFDASATTVAKTIEQAEVNADKVDSTVLFDDEEETVSSVSESEVFIDDDADEEVSLDPDVLDFLDADTYERRLEILGKIKYKITDEMLDIMSTVIDIEVPNGDVYKRYEDFKEALLTRRRYECNRFR